MADNAAKKWGPSCWLVEIQTHNACIEVCNKNAFIFQLVNALFCGH